MLLPESAVGVTALLVGKTTECTDYLDSITGLKKEMKEDNGLNHDHLKLLSQHLRL